MDRIREEIHWNLWAFVESTNGRTDGRKDSRSNTCFVCVHSIIPFIRLQWPRSNHFVVSNTNATMVVGGWLTDGQTETDRLTAQELMAPQVSFRNYCKGCTCYYCSSTHALLSPCLPFFLPLLLHVPIFILCMDILELYLQNVRGNEMAKRII